MNYFKIFLLAASFILLYSCGEDKDPEYLDMLLFNEQEAGIAIVYIENENDIPIEIYIDGELEGSISKKFNGTPNIDTDSENCLKLYLAKGEYNLEAKGNGIINESKTFTVNAELSLIPLQITEEQDLPIIETPIISEIGINNASYSCKILSLGNVTNKDYGFVWSKQANPNLTDNIYSCGNNPVVSQTFTIKPDSLEPFTQYYVKAYLHYGEADTVYSEQVSFTTLEDISMQITGDEIIKLSDSKAEASSTVVDLHKTASQHGHCWSSITDLPTISHSKTQLGELSSDCVFKSTLNNLAAQVTYYVRAYVIIDDVVYYGNTISYTH